MISRKLNKIKKQEEELNVGSIIIAKPFWQDQKYNRSVIILLNHDQLGSTGIILNKQSTLRVKDALPVIGKSLPLFYGGPVDTLTVSYLHNYGEIPEAVYMGDNLYWGGNYEYLQQMITEPDFDWTKIKFFAGFVEWSPGELEYEVGENKWWVSELKSDELFSSAFENLWSFELLSTGHTYGLLADLPDPSLN